MQPSPLAYPIAIAASLAAAALAWPLRGWLDPANLVMLFLLAVFLVAWRLGRGPAMVAAVVNVAVFDFFFVPPYMTMVVSNAQYLVTFAVMLVVAVLTGQLTARLGEEVRAARDRERRTRALYGMARELAGALTGGQVAESTRRFLRDLAEVEATLLLPDAQDRLAEPGADAPYDDDLPRRAYARGQAVEKIGLSGLGEGVLYLPLSAPMRVRGVLEVRGGIDTLRRGRLLLETAASLAAVAVERLHYVEVAQAGEVEMAAERLRNTVLASLSHDLRTPLTALVGLADTLALATPPLPSPHAETAHALRNQAAALAAMVKNLLDLARLAAGGSLAPRKEWQALEEVVGGALRQLGAALDGRAVEIDLVPDLPLLEYDAVLLERVLVNLLDNAARHATPGTAIRIQALRLGDRVEVAVCNAGPGFPAGLDPAMPFARAGLKPGSGLGLAIAKAVVEAHGGRLRLDSPAGGGAVAAFDLPVGEPPRLEDEAA
ncbi:MAG: DUF4118 domain-containing protein [Gallionellaceae bacterium]|nr:DUF4118 domain-containing protein [Gallionellaceae bacterium]